MALMTNPIVVEDGVWVTSRCVVLGGSRIGTSALITPLTVVSGEVPANTIFGNAKPQTLGPRFA
jgi:putative colanic acid biosynthesis acetyltransferase WcaF